MLPYALYTYSSGGKLTILDVRTGAVLGRSVLGTQFEALSYGSMAASGTTMSIVNTKNYFFNEPDDIYFNSVTVFGL